MMRSKFAPKQPEMIASHDVLEPLQQSGVAPANQTQRKGQNEKFMNFAHFCEFWCFSLGKQARFTLNFCSGMPLRKVHELTFLWFGLPGPLLKQALVASRDVIILDNFAAGECAKGFSY